MCGEVPREGHRLLGHCFWEKGIVLPYSYFKINDFIWILLVGSVFKKKHE